MGRDRASSQWSLDDEEGYAIVLRDEEAAVALVVRGEHGRVQRHDDPSADEPSNQLVLRRAVPGTDRDRGYMAWLLRRCAALVVENAALLGEMHRSSGRVVVCCRVRPPSVEEVASERVLIGLLADGAGTSEARARFEGLREEAKARWLRLSGFGDSMGGHHDEAFVEHTGPGGSAGGIGTMTGEDGSGRDLRRTFTGAPGDMHRRGTGLELDFSEYPASAKRGDDSLGGLSAPCSSNLQPRDVGSCVQVLSDQDLAVYDSTQGKRGSKAYAWRPFCLDRVLGPSVGQMGLFRQHEHLVQAAADGLHACLLAYGPVGSGKTHSICGSPDGTYPGLCLRSVDKLLRVLHARGNGLMSRADAARVAAERLEKAAAERGGSSGLGFSSGLGPDGEEPPSDPVDAFKYAVRLSVVEVFQNRVFDLLQGSKAGALHRTGSGSRSPHSHSQTQSPALSTSASRIKEAQAKGSFSAAAASSPGSSSGSKRHH